MPKAQEQTPRPGPKDGLFAASTIRTLWIGLLIVLAILVLLDLGVEHHPHFGIDGTLGFGAWYGFLSCVVLAVLAKGLGLILKRPDTYNDYDR